MKKNEKMKKYRNYIYYTCNKNTVITFITRAGERGVTEITRRYTRGGGGGIRNHDFVTRDMWTSPNRMSIWT